MNVNKVTQGFVKDGEKAWIYCLLPILTIQGKGKNKGNGAPREVGSLRFLSKLTEKA